MNRHILPAFVLFVTSTLLAAGAAAQQPDVTNGKLETRALSGPLAAEFQRLEASTAPVWMAYVFQAVRGQGNSMCSNLENNNSQHNNVVRLEGPENLIVLFRFDNRALDRVRVSSLDCQFDAGGLPFLLLTGVPAAQSVDLLSGLINTRVVTAAGRKSQHDSLITALALHRDPAADRALEAMLAPSQPEALREKVLFWMANSRGKSGFEAVRRVLQSDPSDKVREKATFALTVSKEPAAIPTLVEAARKDRSAKVRSQALFWLAQKAGHQESGVILEAARQDPEVQVRRQAVFALKQIPQGEGTPLLIQLARTSTDTEVRKQALFWLGQSRDPQAVKFFEDVLKEK